MHAVTRRCDQNDEDGLERVYARRSGQKRVCGWGLPVVSTPERLEHGASLDISGNFHFPSLFMILIIIEVIASTTSV